MLSATFASANTLLIEFSDFVDNGDFSSASNFQVHPSEELGTMLTQGVGNIIEVEFGAIISLDTTVTFEGSPPPTNVLSPQTIAIT